MVVLRLLPIRLPMRRRPGSQGRGNLLQVPVIQGQMLRVLCMNVYEVFEVYIIDLIISAFNISLSVWFIKELQL